MHYETLSQLFLTAVETHRLPDALRYKSAGSWRSLSSEKWLERARHLALGFRDLGIRKGDRVALLSENRVEWFLVDKALQHAGIVNVPIYSTLTASQVSFIIQNSESKAVIVSTPEQQAKLASIRGELEKVEHVVRFEPSQESGLAAIDLAELEDRGRGVAERDPGLDGRLAAEVRPDDLATIIYTSGTTGEPKGVMLTHANLVSNVKASLEVLPVTRGDVALTALPYSHVFERMVAHYLYPAAGVTICVAESIEKVVENLAEVRPTIMTFVPRFYEKMHARVLETVSRGSRVRQKLFWWAVSVGRQHGRYRLEGRSAPGFLELKYKLAQALVFKKIRDRVGGRIRFFISGGAPLPKDIAEFFWAAGITILEGYGLTETSPVIAVNRPHRIRFGTVGPAIPGVEMRIADDGEILTRGPHVMKGYYNDPEATRRAIDEEGWFHTGDVGMLDADGFLTITDRKKDLIVTAGGKKLAPQLIENRLKTNAYIQEIVLVGNRRRFPAALVVPDFEKLGQWARELGIAADEKEQLASHPKAIEFIQKQIDEMTSDLAQFEKIKKVCLLAKEFTLEGGELTPTLKVKRNVIESRYQDVIDQLYR